MTTDADRQALRTIDLLPCPACGEEAPRWKPHRHLAGSMIVCERCGAMAAAFGEDVGLRDGHLAWNAWVKRVRKIKEKA